MQSSRHKEVYLSVSSYNFKGDIRSASLIYFLSEFLFHAEEKEIQETLLWDSNRRRKYINETLEDSPMEKEKKQALEKSSQAKRQSCFSKRTNGNIPQPFEFVYRLPL